MSFLPLLYKALDAEFGIVVSASDFDRGRAKLYEARRQSGDAKLERLIFAQGRNGPNEIWIVKKPKEQSDAQDN